MDGYRGVSGSDGQSIEKYTAYKLFIQVRSGCTGSVHVGYQRPYIVGYKIREHDKSDWCIGAHKYEQQLVADFSSVIKVKVRPDGRMLVYNVLLRVWSIQSTLKHSYRDPSSPTNNIDSTTYHIDHCVFTTESCSTSIYSLDLSTPTWSSGYSTL